MSEGAAPELTARIAARVEAFVRDVVVPYESDPAGIVMGRRPMRSPMN